MENHEDIALVKKTGNKVVFVEVERSGSCKNCSISGLCNTKDKSIIHKIKTGMELKVGDRVQVNISPGMRIFSSFVVFILPIILMIFFYVAAKLVFNSSEGIAIISSLLGLIAGGLCIYLIDKMLSEKLRFKIIKKIEV
ncbi:MAG: SoxR reducing system RseC family protein [Candidatus Cloacimonetes bacterium]|nr:SoxR reducing system RseC family protein [Candidatus Cloacimonadota bacterium]